MTLIEVVMALAISGLAVVVGAQLFGNSTQMKALIGSRADRNQLQLWLLSMTDCTYTTQGLNSCTPGALMPLKRWSTLPAPAHVDTYLPATGLRIGNFVLRAECNAAGNGIFVRAARMKPSGTVTSTSTDDFLKEPASGKIYTWTDPHTLLLRDISGSGEGPELCSLSSTETMHTDGPAVPEPTTQCSGTYAAGYCSGFWYKDITFAKPFKTVPIVNVSITAENSSCVCGCTVDQTQVNALNITTSGFRMICQSSPRNVTTATSGCLTDGATTYGDWWNPSACIWTAYEK